MAKPDVLLAVPPERVADWQTACAKASLTVTVCDRRGLSDALARRPAGLLVDALIFDSLAEMQAALANTEAVILVVLPAQASAAERAAAGRLPGVRAVYGPETPLTEVAQQLAYRLTALAAPTTAQQPASRRAALAGVRLAFWGTRGGVGVSTTAWRVAQLLAETGIDVALLDVTRRGDLHLLSGLVPGPEPAQQGNLMIYSGAPTEELAAHHQAVIIDGGRERGVFNAAWIALSKPPSEEQIRRWAHQEPITGNVRTWRVPKLFAIEVTD
jgi:hypothetical protein